MIRKSSYKDIGNRLRHAVCAFGLLISLAALPAYAQQVHQLFYNGSSWTDQNLNGPQTSVWTGVTSYITTPNDQEHAYYMGADQHVHQLFYNGTTWADTDLTAETGAPAIGFNTIAGFSVGNYQYVYYADLDFHVHQMLYNNSGWADTDLTALTGGPQAAANHLVAFTTTPALHIFYVDIQNGHIHQIFNTTGTNWQDQDLTNITGGTLITRAQNNGMAGFNIANFSYLYFVASDGHVHQFLYNNVGWSDEDLTALSKSLPSYAGDNIAAFVVPGTKKLRVYFQAGNNHILQLASTNNVKWSGSDLTKKAKGPLPDYGTSIAGFATTPNNQLHVYYVSESHLNQLLLPTPATAWQNSDLTAETEGGGAGTNYGIAGFSLQNLPYVFYVGD